MADVDPNELYSAEVQPLNSDNSQLVKKWLQLVPIKRTLTSVTESLVYSVKFLPYKPFKTTAEIVVTRSSGGRWRFKVLAEALEPGTDDKIMITSPLNVTSSVQFKLTNSNGKYASDFVAEFSHDSASELTVFPRTGKLEPAVRDGTLFNISFTPVEYGKVKVGKLIIQTNEMYWSFLVKGTFPKYIPPQILKSSIDNNWKNRKPDEDDEKFPEEFEN